MTFTVTLNEPDSRNVTVSYATSDGTASAGSDYTAIKNASLTFAAGETEKEIRVSITDDAVDEDNETFTVTLGSPTNAALGTAAATGTITDDDANPSLSISGDSVTEGAAAGKAVFTVTLSPASGRRATVDYATSGVSATQGTDYVATSGTLTFNAGDTSKTIEVPIVNDAVDEDDETFTVTLSGAVNASLPASPAASGTILDDDTAEFSVEDVSAAENAASGSMEFVVSLSASSDRRLTVDYSTTAGTATEGTDYTAASGTLAFATGETEKKILVPITDDDADEPDETFTLTLSNASNAVSVGGAVGAAAGDGDGGDGFFGPGSRSAVDTATGTITDDDAEPSLSISSPSVTEGDSGSRTMSFTVTLSPASGKRVTVSYAEGTGGSATAGTDYTALGSGTLTFAAGDTTKTIGVSVTGDSLDEPNETIAVKLSSATNATISGATGTGTITDDDSEPAASMSAATASVGESAGTKDVTVSLSAASGRDVTVPYTVSSATGDTATAGGDYTSVSGGSLAIAAGNTSGKITVTVASDTVDEDDETFTVALGAPTNAALGTTKKTVVTITDDDAEPSLSINGDSVAEGATAGKAVFTVTLSPASGRRATVNYATSGVSATQGTDYTATSGTLTFNAGDTSKTIEVPIVKDTVDEDDETFTVTLSGAVNASLPASPAASGTILDDDTAEFSVEDVSAAENATAGSMEFVVSLSASSDRRLTVDYSTTAGTATEGTDYTAASGTLAFATGETEKKILVPITDDDTDEPDETFTLTLINASNAVSVGGAVGAGAVGDGDGGDGFFGPGSRSAVDTATGTIRDDDAEPSLSISSPSVTEGDSGSRTMSFTVTLSPASGKRVTVSYAEGTGGSATAGTDYTALESGTLTFAAGDTTKTIGVSVTGDSLDEPNETIAVKLSSATNATISGATGTGTITDDDAEPSLSISSPSVTEGDSGSRTMSFTVTLSPASGKQVTVNYADAGTGTATSGTDYTAITAGTLTFAAGDTTKTIGVTVAGDSLDEADETVEVKISSPTNAALGTAAGTGTITDDDAKPSLSISGDSVTEGAAAGKAVFTVTMSPASGRRATVDYATSGVSATQGTDYTATSGTLTFAAGDTSKTIEVPIVNDAVDEDDETFTVTLSGAVNASLPANPAASGTILDDDTAEFSVEDVSAAENAATGSMEFVVSLSTSSDRRLTVDYSTTAGTATEGTDYTAASGTLAFATGETEKKILVPITDDDADEPDETFTLTLSNASNAVSVGGAVGAAVGDGDGGDGFFGPGSRSAVDTATGTITDDDAEPSLSISSPSVTEGDSGSKTMSFTVTLSPASGKRVTVSYAEGTGGSATAGTDYTALESGTLTFAAGDTSKTIGVTVAGDSLDETNETVVVTLSSATNATISGATGTGTITDDDAEPSLSISSPSVTEGDSGSKTMSFTVTLSPASGKRVTVNYADAGTGTATSGTDYTAITAGTLTFSAGDTTKTIGVTVAGDSLDEADETVEVKISSPTNAALGTAAGTGTITDDDAKSSLSISGDSVTEGAAAGKAVFTVTLSPASGRRATVDYATSGVSATQGTDYAATSGTLTFNAGDTSKTIEVPIVNDAVDEDDETFTVTLSGAVNASLPANPAASGTILDDDTAEFSVEDVSAAENAATGSMEFVVSLSASSDRRLTVDYSTTAGTATEGADYTAASGTLTFATGETEKKILVPITDDDTDEPDETFTLTLSNASNAVSVGGAVGAGAVGDGDGGDGFFGPGSRSAVDTATGTITDDDAEPSLSISSPSVTEGDSGSRTMSFTVTLSPASGKRVTVSYAEGTGGSATAGTDYTALESGTLTFAAGDTSKDIAVTVKGDALNEPNETIAVKLSSPVNATISTATGTGTITDDDSQPTVSMSAATASVGESDGTKDLTVSLSAASGRAVTVPYTVSSESGDTAATGTDYTSVSSGSLSIAAGDAGGTITVTVTSDTVDEDDETFTVTLGTPTNAALGTTTRTVVTITDDDAAPTLSISSPSVTEGDNGSTALTFKVTLSAASGRQVKVNYADAGTGTATSGTDYTAITAGALTFSAGDTSKDIDVSVTGDGLNEPNETVVVTLSSATNATISGATGTGTITDDDSQPVASMSAATASVGESDGTKDLTVSLSAASGKQVTVPYTVSSESGDTATATTDYTSVSTGSLTIAAGNSSGTITVTVVPDTLDEDDETFTVTLGTPTNAALGTTTRTVVTITDDDSEPTLSISSPSVTEGDSGSAALTFKATLSAASGKTVKVNYADAGTGTATSGTDYEAITAGTLTFSAGDTSKDIDVSVKGDALNEPNETVEVKISSPTNATISAATGTGTITDDDSQPVASMSAATASVGESDGTKDLTVSLSAASGKAVTVPYTVSSESGDTATATTDYTSVSGGSLQIAAGNSSGTITVTVVSDTLDEDDETFTVALGAPTNAALGSTTRTVVTITDDDSEPTLSISSPSVTEGDSGSTTLTFKATLSAASDRQVKVNYADAGTGTATSGTDYEAITDGTLTFSAGDTSKDIAVTVKGDALNEPNETIAVKLTSPVNATISAATGTGTITDDDSQPTVSMSAATASVGESDGTKDLTVSLSAASGKAVTVPYTVSSESGDTATAGTDYTSVSGGSLSIAAGDAGGTITVTVTSDTVDEDDETFTVTLGTPTNAALGSTTRTVVTITDDDSEPTLSISSPSVTEGDSGSTTLTFKATLSAASDRQVKVNYADAGTGTATSGTDYEAITDGTLTFSAGDTSKDVAVTVKGDALNEPNETIAVKLISPVNATISAATGTGTITDDDSQPVASMSAATASVGESAGTKDLTVSLSAASGKTVTVPYTVSSESGDTATATTDYTSVSNGSLQIAAGDAGGTITVTVVSDTLDEDDETFTVTLGTPTNAALGTPTRTVVTITDDDSEPSLSISSPSVTEGDSGSTTLTFKATLSAASDRQVKVNYADAGTGTATSGTDYEAITDGTLTFSAGDTSKDVAVTVKGDALNEPNETIAVKLTSPVNATISAATGTGTITDDDSQPTVSMSAATASVGESDGTKDLTVSLSAASGKTVTVPYTVSSESGDTATAGTDYTSVSSGSLSIAAGDAGGTITVTVTSDTVDEDDETFTVTLGTPTNAALGSTTRTVVTITDDDSEPTLSISSPSVTEGDSGSTTLTFKATLSAASDRQVKVNYADAGTGTATSGTDYEAITDGTLTFSAGDTSKDIAVTVKGDALNEPNETIAVKLISPVNASISTATGTGTITDDDDPPSLSIADSSADESAGSMDFTVRLSAASGKEASVYYATSDGTAEAGSDYVAVSSTKLVFAAGDTSKTVSVTLKNDSLNEDNETFTVTLSTPTNASISDSSATGTINKNAISVLNRELNPNDPGSPTLSISSPSVTEGDSGSKTMSFTVSLSPASESQVTVSYADAGTGTATSGTDYTAITAEALTFAAGDTTKTIGVTVAGDSLDEADETVVVTLSSATNASISTPTGTGTITDDDDPPSLSVADSSADESEGSMDFTVRLSAASGKEASVYYATSDGTAEAGSDYVAVSSTKLVFAAGDTSKTVSVTLKNDSLNEEDETFTVTLSSPTNASISDSSATGTINRNAISLLNRELNPNDPESPTLSISSPSVTEGDSGSKTMSFTVSLSPASESQVTVSYADAGTGTATSGTDYTAITAEALTFAAGDTTKTIGVTVAGDSLDEADETVVVTLSSATNASISTPTGTGTITDDDDPPSLSVADSSADESEGSMDFTVRLSAASGKEASVYYATSDGTAEAGSDYVAVSSTKLVFAAGDTSKTVSVTLKNDSLNEDDETFTVTLSSPTNASISDSSATGTINRNAISLLNRETNPNDPESPTLSISSPSVTEGDSGSKTMSFTVTLSPASESQVTVNYADAGTGTATSGTDYTAITAGALTFAVGDTTKTIGVTVAGDSLDEADETVVVTLSSATNATISGATGTGTITNDDSQPVASMSAATASVGESDGTKDLTVSLSAASGRAVTVPYTVSSESGDTAAAGTDYTSVSTGSLTIAAGDAGGTITVTVTSDTVDEDDETLTVTLGTPTNAALGTTTRTVVTITDDDVAPTLSISSPSVTEGDSGSAALTFKATLSAASGKTVKVNYADAGTGTATSGTDYEAITAGTLTFSAGDTSKDIAVTVKGDALNEPNETIAVKLSSPVNATISTATGTGTITDDDSQPVASMSAATASVGESAGTKDLTVSLSAASGRAVTVPYTVSSESGDTATAGTDYTAVSSGSLSIAAGDAGGTITVTVTSDTVDEDDETLTVTLGTPTNAALGTTTRTVVTITDDDAAPSLSISSPSVTEGDSGSVTLTFKATLSAASGKTVKVNYADAGTGTATSGTDYEAITAGTLTFSAGDTSEDIAVTVKGDVLNEPNETIAVKLSSPVNATISTATGTGTITDDDSQPVASMSAGTASVGESDGTKDLTVSLSAASGRAVTVPYTVSSESGDTATAGTDYTSVSTGSLSIAAGDAGGTITVAVASDTLDEDDETFTVTLGTPTNAALGTTTRTVVTITDDDSEPSLSISSPSVTEGDSGSAALTFKVTLSAASGRQVTVNYADAGTGTATSGTDYTAITAGGLTFDAGDTSKDIDVSVTGDALNEPNETVVVTLSSATNATISGATGTGTITDDDGSSLTQTASPGLSVDDINVGENISGGKAKFTVRLTSASTQEVTVRCATSDGTATAGSDYTATSETLTFAAGETEKTFAVDITNDTINETDETFTVTLSSPTGDAVITRGAATGTIEDDDSSPDISLTTPRLSIADASVAENVAGGKMAFTVTLSAPGERDVSVDYETTGDSATEGTDYTTASGTLELVSGDTETRIIVPITNDDLYEADETFTVTLSSPSNATLETETATGTIVNDDTLSSISIEDPASVTESDAGSTTEVGFTVTLSPANDQATTVSYATADGTAEGGSDYQTEAGTLTFAAGETSKTISISVNGDEVAEANETFSVILSAPSSNAELVKDRAQAVIQNDDELTVMPSSPETLFVGETTVRVVVDSIDRQLGVGIVIPPMPTFSNNPIENITVTFSDTDREINGKFGYTGRRTDHSLVDIGVSPVPDGGIPLHMPVMETLLEVAGDQRILLIQHLDGWTVLDSEIRKDTVTADRVTRFSTSFGVSYERVEARERTRAVNEAILPELARAMTSSTVKAVTGRIEEAFSGTARNKLAGQSIVSRPEEVQPHESHEGTSLSWQEALGGSSFTVSLADGAGASEDQRQSHRNNVAFWVAGDYRRLSGDSDEFMIDWNGRIIGGHLGADIELGSGVLAGVATSFFKGSLDYTDRFGDASIEGKHKSRMTGFHPYLGWSLSERLSLWATVGWGFGRIEIDDEEISGLQSSDSRMRTAAVGGDIRLFSTGATAFSLKSEAWLTSLKVEDNSDLIQGLKVDANRLRLAVKGVHTLSLESGALITPSLELGVRRDGGDGETGFGTGLQGGIVYSTPALGLTLEASGHTLLAHKGNVRDWGKICAIRLDPNSDRRGLSLSVLPSYGKISSGVEQLWESDVTDHNTTDYSASVRVDTEIGYGIPAFDGRGVVIPYGIFGPSGQEGQTYRLGSRFEIGSGLGLSLEGNRRMPDMGDPEHGIMLRGQMSW